MWLDSHCHLSAAAFADDLPETLGRARAAGVEALVAIGSGYGVAANRRAVALAKHDDRIFAAVGVHPHEAVDLDDAGRDLLEELFDAPRVVAVGETGLDYHYMNSPRDVQREVFAEQLAVARRRHLPVSIHVRGDAPDAYGEMLDIWRAEGRGQLEGVLHCYTGSLEFAQRAIGENLYVSFSGILTFARDRGLRAVAAALPLSRLLVETDAPLLAPEGHRGRRNEPMHVSLVGETLARIRGESIESVARTTTANARRLFRLGAAE
jgi:TatD DNase family protein